MILSGRGGVGSSGGGVGNGGGYKFPFTPSQWQELEHQALIFKYMVSGVPIPHDLLFTFRRSLLDSTSTSPHMGWSCFQIGLGMRKIDTEPGRCRRTDGKKWRCSKEAFQESKYCEKHMHRGKNRSRKPVEQPQQQQLHLQQVLASSSSMVKPTKHYSSSLSSSVTSDPHHNNNNQLYPSSYRSNTHTYHHSTQLGLHSGVDRWVVDENGQSLMNGDSWGLSPLKMSSANGGRMISTKEHNQQEYPPYFQLQGIEDYESSGTHDDDGGDYDDNGRTSRTRREKTVYRFLEECPPDNNNSKESASWLNLDDNKSSNCSSSSTTQLSISIPTTTTSTTSQHHQLFPLFNFTHQTNF